MSKSKRGRPGVIDQLKEHFKTGNVFPQLEELATIATKENDGTINMAVILDAVKASTDLTFGAVAFRNMIRKSGRGRVRADSVLGQLARIARGAPKGSCEGQVRNQWGRNGNPATVRSRAAKKGYATRQARLAAATS